MKPLLCNTGVARNILDGIQTQDRRPVKHQRAFPDNWYGWSTEAKAAVIRQLAPWHPGDILYAREAFCYAQLSGYDARDDGGEIWYRASDEGEVMGPWKPSIHMPKWVARIFLKVKRVWVERIQDISEDDAKAEGVTMEDMPFGYSIAFLNMWENIYPGTTKKNIWVWAMEVEKIDKPDQV